MQECIARAGSIEGGLRYYGGRDDFKTLVDEVRRQWPPITHSRSPAP